MAPEILDPDKYGYVKKARGKLPSKSTDIYALGMTVLEERAGSHSILFLSPNVDFSLQVATGRRPFENINVDTTVIPKVLSGIRPDRPTAEFSDALWALLIQTWLEVFESSEPGSIRPDITEVIGQLQDEAGTWSPASILEPQIVQTEAKENRGSPVYSEFDHELLTGPS